MVDIKIGVVLALVASAATGVPLVEEDFSNYPEIIPGPGLPSLESLGLTSADIYRQTLARKGSKSTPEKSSFEERAPPGFPRCDTFARCPDTLGAACNTYLYNLGATNCEVSGENKKFCNAGSCNVWGTNMAGHSISSYCRDVAGASAWILDRCSSDGQTQLEGTSVANGNGELLVTINAYT